MARRLRTAANLASAVRSASRPGSPSLLQRVAALPRMIRAVRSGRRSLAAYRATVQPWC